MSADLGLASIEVRILVDATEDIYLGVDNGLQAVSKYSDMIPLLT